MDYGFLQTGNYRKPDEKGAIALIHQALDEGINLIDTAPVYGTSEQLIGKALKGHRRRAYLATKITIPPAVQPFAKTAAQLADSIDSSLQALGVETIDLLQIHNKLLEVLANEEFLKFLDRARAQGKIRFLGASTYQEDETMPTLGKARIDALQVPFNILNQSMARRVFREAPERGKGLLVRSAFLRGLLTSQIDDAPASLAPLKKMALAAMEEMKPEVESLSEGALRYCLSFPAVATVLVGMRSRAELAANVAAADKGALSGECIARLSRYSMEWELLSNPANWTEVV
jgi:aryl-alcohol dehydrogenase-like predicted oxidoreductase